MDKEWKRGTEVLSTTGEIGKLTGGRRHCGLEGCNGVKLGVRWPDKKLTFPCTKGMTWKSETSQWQIEPVKVVG